MGADKTPLEAGDVADGYEWSGVKMDLKYDDAELDALAAIATIFGSVPQEAHGRMARYIRERWEVPQFDGVVAMGGFARPPGYRDPITDAG